MDGWTGCTEIESGLFVVKFLKVTSSCVHFFISGQAETHLNHKDTEAQRTPDSVFDQVPALRVPASPRLRVSVVDVFASCGCGCAALGSLVLILPCFLTSFDQTVN